MWHRKMGRRWRPVLFQGGATASSVKKNGGGPVRWPHVERRSRGVRCCVGWCDMHAVGGGRNPGVVAAGHTAWAARTGDSVRGI
jgi:hypothetical protein